MRQRLTIILTFVVIIGLLVLINAVTYVKNDDIHDMEIAPNRSTYHAGPTGTRALHDFLSESGYKVIRWRESPERLLGDAGSLVKTFVVVGETPVPFTDDEAKALRRWVAQGGRFVLINRTISTHLVPAWGGWRVDTLMGDFPGFDVDPADATQMTQNVTALHAVQPTVLTRDIQAVMPSRFASRLKVVALAEDAQEQLDPDEAIEEYFDGSPTPILHIADGTGALLVDYSYGLGSIVVLSDPYIVSNGGIKLNDNLQLAINTLVYHDGLVAFDEYHHGRGISRNALASYFEGTPVIGLAAQIVLLILLVLWTNGRRFGRPLPLPKVDRRSSLEFVASMAELQERSRAFDLAIENIYTRTRRVLARYAGLNYNSPRSEIAERVAARSSIDQHKLETLMRQCEEAINGEPINWRQSIELVRRLREVERDLGLRMRSRELRQAAENI